ncbi:MAG: efflux RND transporter periplasmic adaptor subunit [Bacteroidales bacterium]|nr:efflux RND transporter periplasmic adaptor subunit [Bacteroidales bacterium]
MKKRLLIIACVLAATIVSCGRQSDTQTDVKQDKIVEVKVLQIQPGNGGGSFSYVGTVKASKSAKIAAKYSGALEKLNVSKGKYVSKGAVVAEISSQTIKSAYETANATYNYAKDAVDRVSQVKDAGGVTEQKMIELQTEHDKAYASLQGARQAVEECRLKAPFAGVIGDVLVEEGENVSAMQPVVTIFDINSLEIEIPVPEAEISDVKVGDIMQVTVPALGGEMISAKVASRGVVASSITHSYTCTLSISGKVDGLLPGMVCSVNKKDEIAAQIVVPTTAVKADTEGRYLWIANNGIAEKRHITVAGYCGSGIIVAEGISEGDMVIISGMNKVGSGTKVKTLGE